MLNDPTGCVPAPPLIPTEVWLATISALSGIALAVITKTAVAASRVESAVTVPPAFPSPASDPTSGVPPLVEQVKWVVREEVANRLPLPEQSAGPWDGKERRRVPSR